MRPIEDYPLLGDLHTAAPVGLVNTARRLPGDP